MKTNKEVKISYWASHLTTIVSVTLVLLIIGTMALIGIAAAGETRSLKEKIELSVVTADSVTDTQAGALLAEIKKRPYVNSARLITRKQALDNWTKQTGENLEEVFGVNPLSPEIAFTLKEEYTAPDRMNAISRSLSGLPGVEGVAVPDVEMVKSMNENIEKFSWILGGIAAVLLVISFVLINNTVHLTVYSRRFTIHTMQLVGATNWFITRPIIRSNMLSGIISGIAASGILAAALAGAGSTRLLDTGRLVPPLTEGILFAGLLLAGTVICSLAAWIAAAKYLRRDYDRLFR